MISSTRSFHDSDPTQSIAAAKDCITVEMCDNRRYRICIPIVNGSKGRRAGELHTSDDVRLAGTATGPFRFNTPYTRDSHICLLEHHVESLPTRTQEGDVSRGCLILSLISSSSLHSLWIRSCLYIFMVAERSAALCVVLIFS